MTFDKTKVYSVTNADELEVGSMIIVADNLAELRAKVKICDSAMGADIIKKLKGVRDDTHSLRFEVKIDHLHDMVFNLAYLIKEPQKMSTAEQHAEKWLQGIEGEYCVINDRERLKQYYIIGFEKGYNYAREELLNESDEVYSMGC